MVSVLPGLTVGQEWTVEYRVPHSNMVGHLLPDVPEFARKPDVMATGWLVGVCEWPVMEALRVHMSPWQCSLGRRIELTHLAPVPAGATLRATARCMHIDGNHSEWNVDVWDDVELVGAATVEFVVVDIERFVCHRLAPKSAALMANAQVPAGLA